MHPGNPCPQGLVLCPLSVENGRLPVPEEFHAGHPVHPEQKKILKAMSPSQKWKAAMDLYYSTRELKTAGLRRRYPLWTGEKIDEKVREIFEIEEYDLEKE